MILATFGAAQHRRQATVVLEERAQALQERRSAVLARHRQHVLAMQRRSRSGLPQDVGDVLLDEVRLALFDDENRALAFAEANELGVDQRVRDVHHVQRNLRLAEHIGQPEPLQRPQDRVVAATLDGEADVVRVLREELVELALFDELDGGRPAVLDLLLLMQKARRRQHDAAHVAHRVLHRLLDRECGATVFRGNELPMHMAGADPQLQHDRRAARLRQVEAVLDGLHDARQVRTRIQQPDLRLHRKGVAALLHDRRALAVILADDDERSAEHAA